jgi:hypothetical protein
MNIKLKLNNFFEKVVHDYNIDQVNDYTIEIAKKYNEIWEKHPKYKCRPQLNINYLVKISK